MAFKAGGIDREAQDKETNEIKERQKKAGGFERDEELFYNLGSKKDGTSQSHTIRILPGFIEINDERIDFNYPAGKWATVVVDHHEVPGTAGANGKLQKIRCISRSFPERNESCDICDARQKLREWMRSAGLNDGERRKMVAPLYDYQRAYVNAIVRGSDIEEEVEYNGETITIPKIRIIGLPVNHVYGWIGDRLAARNEDGEREYNDFNDPFTGLDLEITVVGKGLDTKYTCSFRQGQRPIHKDDKVCEAVCVNAKKLCDMFSYPKAEKLALAKIGGDKLLARIGDTPEGEKGQPGSNEESPVGTAEPREAFPKADGKPACYTNHLPANPTCLKCAYELNCRDEDATKAKTVEVRQAEFASINPAAA
jgi:hypothetical protein